MHYCTTVKAPNFGSRGNIGPVLARSVDSSGAWLEIMNDSFGKSTKKINRSKFCISFFTTFIPPIFL